MRLLIAVMIVSVLPLASPSPAHADVGQTCTPPLTYAPYFYGLVRDAPIIVVGEVLAVEGPYTFQVDRLHIGVETYYNGSGPSVLTMTDFKDGVCGPTVQAGGRYVFFMYADGRAFYTGGIVPVGDLTDDLMAAVEAQWGAGTPAPNDGLIEAFAIAPTTPTFGSTDATTLPAVEPAPEQDWASIFALMCLGSALVPMVGLVVQTKGRPHVVEDLDATQGDV